MRILEHDLGVIYVPGPADSLDQLYRRRGGSAEFFAADTETTGLNQFLSDFRCKILQCGWKDEAWILRPEWHMQAIHDMAIGGEVWWHNWTYDALTLEQSCDLDFDALAASAHCTEILARLVDPRPKMKGGSGHKLEELGEHYLGVDSKKNARNAIYDAWGRRNKIPKNECVARAPVDLEEFLVYAGQDVFLTARLAEKLAEPLSNVSGLEKFFVFERKLSAKLALMTRIGMPFDYEWAARAEREYMDEFEAAEKELITKWRVELGTCANAHTAKDGMIRAFTELGVKWMKKTPTGQISLDKSVLEDLAERKGDIGQFARTVERARVNKHYAGYITSMVDNVGYDGKIHPSIRAMEAATHRMSMSNPAIHQFPRGDPRPRGCLLADNDDSVIICIDLNQIEFRLGGAISQDPKMIKMILDGQDLHGVTATALFGEGYTKDQRQCAKPVGLGRLYLGGAKGILQQMKESDTTGQVPSLYKVQKAIRAFDSTFRVYNRWATRLVARADNDNGRIVTATGRRLIASPAYKAPNYYIQSTARDIFAAGINRAHAEGLGDYIRLPMHDEIVASAPRDEAEELIKCFEDAMASVFKGVPLAATGAIAGERWAKV